MGLLTLRQRVRMLAPCRCLGCRGALVTGPFPTSLMEEMAYRYGVCVGCQLKATPVVRTEQRTPWTSTS